MKTPFLTGLCIFVTVLLIGSCGSVKEPTSAKSNITSASLHQWNETLEAAIVNDFFPPPVAGRIYTYPNIAAYEVISQTAENYNSIADQYEEFQIPNPSSADIDLNIAAIYAFYYTSMELVYAVDILETGITEFRKEMTAAKVEEASHKAAEEYGKAVAMAVIDWAKKDTYNQMRSFPKYQLLEGEGKWLPTPPDYNDALEPHWKKLRPFTLDSASQFRPVPPTEYDMDTNSTFYAELMQVYHAVKENDDERVAIAKFWDCNPLVTKHKGHVTFAEKKLTPGGHWVNIGRMAMKEQNFDLIQTSYTYAMLTIGINDAFISCWDEKYNSNYIRPVTVIQKNIETAWTPILYTPNFPEYPSGHSVVSGSAATILTNIFGEDYSFTDSTEVPYGMPPRSFNSFFAASDEAAISRMYGGIHFMPAIEEGKTQGRKVGAHVLKKMQLKSNKENS